MNKKEYKEFEKRYDKFKNNNLPTPFWDEERLTLEYVYYNDDKRRVDSSLYEALGDIAFTNLYYPFTSGYWTGNTEEDFRYEVGHNHGHSFEDVVRWLYDYPESFSISKEEEQFYSKQELEYLKEVKEYLLFIGMKDCKEEKRSKSRFKNKNQKKYQNYGIMRCKNELQKEILSGKRDYLVAPTEYPEIYPDQKQYAKNERLELMRNLDGKMIALLEFTKFAKKKYKDFKKEYNNKVYKYESDKELKDDDYVIVNHFKIIAKYQ